MASHLDTAIRELRAAQQARDCGVCHDLLDGQIRQLQLLADLSGKVETLTTAQDKVTTDLVEGNRRADQAMGVVPSAGESGAVSTGGPFGLVDMIQNRIRVVDILQFGGLRRNG